MARSIYNNALALLEELGVRDELEVLELDDGEEVYIEARSGGFYAKGPGVLFHGFLPREAFE